MCSIITDGGVSAKRNRDHPGISRNRIFLLIALGILLGSCHSYKKESGSFSYRWFYVSRSLHKDRDVEEISELVRTASRHRLNGMVLSGGFDRLDMQPAEYFRRFTAVKDTCEKYGIEIIPILFSVGYGGSILAHNPNLAAGLPVKEAPFLVKGGRAHLIHDPAIRIANGGFERFQGKKAAEIQFHEKPGDISTRDGDVFKKGRASLRFQNFNRTPHGHGRMICPIRVQPYRSYRITCFVKTESLRPTRAFMLQIRTENSRLMTWIHPKIRSTQDWKQIAIDFNSLGNKKIKFYAGVWGGKSGKFWLDELRIEEVAFANLLRRPGTPVTVKNASTRVVYQQGKNYRVIPDRKINFHFDHPGGGIQILPGSRIAEGDTLLISYYHGLAAPEGQVSICMSEPEVYRIWTEQIRRLKQLLNPDKIFLSMDEIRAGGTCLACQKRRLTLAQILGDCITRQEAIIRAELPRAEIFIWSDMLDPNHNAHAHYYMTEGDFRDSWAYVPGDLIIVCWNYRIREKSLRHFSRLGFPVMAAAYYDAETLENPQGWLQALAQVRNARGIIYTTWQNKYRLLSSFGDLLEKNKQ